MSLTGKTTGKTLRGHIKALRTIRGYSAYEIAVINGFSGTEEEWLQSLEANPDTIERFVREYLEENPTTVDTTLTKEGQAADAKATGDAIRKISAEAVNGHIENKENPHGVTKAQVGLGNVDNTSDMNKPVSTAQATAIADAKKAGTDAQTTADSALAKANAAQPNLGFVPVQQGFADGSCSSKIRLGWKQASNGYWTIGVEVDNQYIGDVVVDSSAFGATTPISRGGTGATTADAARTNLGVPAEKLTMTITQGSGLDCDAIFDAGLTLMRNAKNLPCPEPYGTLLTLPYRYTKGNSQPSYAAQICLPKGDSATKADTMFFRTSLDTSWRQWREVLTTVLDDHLYSDSFPADAVTGQLHFVKG